MNHADAVINRGETFQAGDTGEIDGLICMYVEVPGDFLGESRRTSMAGLTLDRDWRVQVWANEARWRGLHPGCTDRGTSVVRQRRQYSASHH
jgi:hypothetical protein